jgi:DNA-binding XRE family transcriptional regulator
VKQWTPNQLKSFRGKYKLTQIKLGKLVGVTTNYIYLLEKGVKEPSKTLTLLLDCVEEKLKKGGE